MAKLEDSLKQLLSQMNTRLSELEDDQKHIPSIALSARINELTMCVVGVKTILDGANNNTEDLGDERRAELKRLYPDTLTIEECNRKMLIDILTEQGLKNDN